MQNPKTLEETEVSDLLENNIKSNNTTIHKIMTKKNIIDNTMKALSMARAQKKSQRKVIEDLIAEVTKPIAAVTKKR